MFVQVCQLARRKSEFYAIEVSLGAQNSGRELQGRGIARSCQSDCRLGAGLLCSDRFTAVYIHAKLARTRFSRRFATLADADKWACRNDAFRKDSVLHSFALLRLFSVLLLELRACCWLRVGPRGAQWARHGGPRGLWASMWRDSPGGGRSASAGPVCGSREVARPARHGAGKGAAGEEGRRGASEQPAEAGQPACAQ